MDVLKISKYVSMIDDDISEFIKQNNYDKIRMMPLKDCDGTVVIVACAGNENGAKWNMIIMDEDEKTFSFHIPKILIPYIEKEVKVYKNSIDPVSKNEIFRWRLLNDESFNIRPVLIKTRIRKASRIPHFTKDNKLVFPSLWLQMNYDERILNSKVVFKTWQNDDYKGILLEIRDVDEQIRGTDYKLFIKSFGAMTASLSLIREWLDRVKRRLIDYEFAHFGKLEGVLIILFKEREYVRADYGRPVLTICRNNQPDDGFGITNVKPTKAVKRNERKVKLRRSRRGLRNRSECACVQADFRKIGVAGIVDTDDL